MDYSKYINSIRLLSLNAIKKAKQGHVGMSMSAATITYTLFTKHINISSVDPKWINRDRFILSAGHGSLSIYSILHFSGLISLEEFKKFKNNSEIVPGHPEYLKNNFIDASTGPLGQGIGMAVGNAIAQKYIVNKFKSISDLFDHYVYALVGDGDIQEGISYESMSLAGKLKLNKLIVLHDSNDYQLDSSVETVFNEDLQKRMESMGWFYLKVNNEVDEIDLAISLAKKQDKPTYIEVKTLIGYGTKNINSNKSHSMSLSEDDIEYAKTIFDLKNEEFSFGQNIYDHFKTEVLNRNRKYEKWLNKFKEYERENNSDFIKFNNYLKRNYKIEEILKNIKFSKTSVATRNYVKDLMDCLKNHNSDFIIAGCADLEAATNIKINDSDFNYDYSSNNIKYGIREFAMGAITNGILLHSCLKTISGTFLVFSDYLKSAIRLGTLMSLPNFYIFTHDSYQVGGDGPTHQPIEQLAMLRSIPRVNVFRPCDETEFLAASYKALKSTSETNILVLTRQPLKSKINTSLKGTINDGGYVLESDQNPDITIAGCGSEIDLLFDVKQDLNDLNYKVKIVSIPSLNIFLNNKESKIKEILNSKYGLFTIEPSSDAYWYKLSSYVKSHIHFEAKEYGKSMDGDALYKEKGFNKDNIKNLILRKLIKYDNN
ncbi:transketolase [Malacoplasma penetrans]|uniref:Transketolase n=1 Tax=Malacoplasma penetrans (strain HF-2) TaxID=272633 RepID=Q8EVV8_MALP2|nr:transketolase [Malacoplasma penetrans]RXY97243.1 transketolase [Malacoplasma penetrans]BAC44241.1 transketolase I [Malacoplasma penetrans HF-2]